MLSSNMASEIEEFIDLRRPTGGSNRKALNLHHGSSLQMIL